MLIKHNLTQDQILTPAQFVSGLVALKNASKAWYNQSHLMIASAVCHAHLFGDVRQIEAVFKVMPAGAKTNSMREYVLLLGPVKWSTASKKFKFDATKQVKDIMTPNHVEHLSRILNDHWSAFGPQEKPENFKPFDLKARLDRLLADMNKALDAPEAAIRETIKPVDVNKVAELRKTMFGEAA